MSLKKRSVKAAVWSNFTTLLPVFRVIERNISENMTYSLASKVDGGHYRKRIHLDIVSDRIPENKKKLLAVIVKEKEIIFRCANRFIEGVVKAHVHVGLPVEIRVEQLNLQR